MFVKALPNDVAVKIEAALEWPFQFFMNRQKQAITGHANSGLPDFTERRAEGGFGNSRLRSQKRKSFLVYGSGCGHNGDSTEYRFLPLMACRENTFSDDWFGFLRKRARGAELPSFVFEEKTGR